AAHEIEAGAQSAGIGNVVGGKVEVTIRHEGLRDVDDGVMLRGGSGRCRCGKLAGAGRGMSRHSSNAEKHFTLAPTQRIKYPILPGMIQPMQPFCCMPS